MPNNTRKEIEDSEESEFQKSVKKVLRILIGLFLIFLMLSFVVPQEVLLSLALSKTPENYVIDLGNKEIVFEKAAYERLRDYYFTHQFSEFKLCLTGKIQDEKYIIDDLYSPKIFLATPVSVHSVSCSDGTLIDLHSHPFRNCLFSEQDVVSYNKLGKETIGAVMCDIDRFNFYVS